MHDQLMHCHRILPREASAGSRQNSSENHPMYTQDKAISQDTGFAPKQDIWLCPVTNFVTGQPSSSFKGQKFSSSALSCESVMFKIEITTFAFRLLYNCFVSCYMEGHLHYNICPMKHAFHWHFYLTKPLENKGKRNAKFPFLLYHAKILLFLLKYH